jgi:hypothetical protein
MTTVKMAKHNDSRQNDMQNDNVQNDQGNEYSQNDMLPFKSPSI